MDFLYAILFTPIMYFPLAYITEFDVLKSITLCLIYTFIYNGYIAYSFTKRDRQKIKNSLMSADKAVKYPYDYEVEIDSSGVLTEPKYGGHTVLWSSVRSIEIYNDKIEF